MEPSAATALRPGDLEALPGLVARMNSSLELDQVLDHAIEVCARLTGCEGALVYLWEEERGRLVVRGAIEGYQQWIGRFSLEPGQGLTGWTALTRRVGIITEQPLCDPRYHYVPDLNDERFQSVATIPVVGRSDQLIGVLTLHTVAPHEFSEGDVELLQTIASLVAGAVENAQLHERALRSVEVFRRLADLSRQMTSASSPAQTLQKLALTTLELFDGSLAAVLRLDEVRAQLTVETWVASDDSRLRPETIAADVAWARLLGGGPASIAPAQEPSLRLSLPARSLHVAPLLLEGRPTGLLCCWSAQERSLDGENLELLGTIANHASIALEEERRRSAVAHRTHVRELFESLRSGERPSLDRPHVVVLVEAGPGAELERVCGSLAAELAAAFPGTLSDVRPNGLRALVPIASSSWSGRLEQLLAVQLQRSGERAPLDVGAGLAGPVEHGYALAFRQAAIAATLARAAAGEHPVRHYDALGAQRYLWTIAREGDADPLETAVTRLSELDARKGSQLFRTLEVYLELHGNVRRAADTLYIHRNTLRQRLRRISEIIDRDVRDPGAWFDLGLAVRLVRFRGTAGRLLDAERPS